MLRWFVWNNITHWLLLLSISCVECKTRHASKGIERGRDSYWPGTVSGRLVNGPQKWKGRLRPGLAMLRDHRVPHNTILSRCCPKKKPLSHHWRIVKILTGHSKILGYIQSYKVARFPLLLEELKFYHSWFRMYFGMLVDLFRHFYKC